MNWTDYKFRDYKSNIHQMIWLYSPPSCLPCQRICPICHFVDKNPIFDRKELNFQVIRLRQSLIFQQSYFPLICHQVVLSKGIRTPTSHWHPTPCHNFLWNPLIHFFFLLLNWTNSGLNFSEEIRRDEVEEGKKCSNSNLEANEIINGRGCTISILCGRIVLGSRDDCEMRGEEKLSREKTRTHARQGKTLAQPLGEARLTVL